jgi:hypothetical protein
LPGVFFFFFFFFQLLKRLTKLRSFPLCACVNISTACNCLGASVGPFLRFEKRRVCTDGATLTANMSERVEADRATEALQCKLHGTREPLTAVNLYTGTCHITVRRQVSPRNVYERLWKEEGPLR